MMWTSRGGLPGPCRAQSLCASQPAVCRRSALPTALCPHTGLRHTPAPHTSSHLRSQHSRRPHRRAQAAETAADPSIAAADEMLDSEASTARAKMDLLEELRKRSEAAISEAENQSAPPRLIDARMYNATVLAQKKLSTKLSEANAYIRIQEDRMKHHDEDMMAASEIFRKVSMEFGTTGRLADAAVAAVKFGVDKEDAIVKILRLKDRLEALEKAMKKERDNFSKRVPRKVPITWVGTANEVRMVGDFDNWGRGVDLSIPDLELDGVLRTFETTVNLLPGRYMVKFMVDGQWRLAPEWPMEKDSKGETNNILIVH